MARVKKLSNCIVREKTLHDAAVEFLSFKRAQKCSDLTLRDYTRTLARFEKRGKGLLELTVLKEEVLAFLNDIPDTSPAVYNVPYSNLNSFFNWCVRQEYIKHNPIHMLGLKKKRDEGNIRSVQVKSIQYFLSYIDLKEYTGFRDYVICLLMMDTGVRPRECFSIEEEDLNIEERIIHIKKQNAKTRVARDLPVSEIVFGNILKLLSFKPKEWGNKRVFCSYEGLPLTTEAFGKRLNIYSDQSGIKITPYQLRHSFATIYLKNNGNLFSLQRMMGHTDLRMTKRYIDIDKEQLTEQHQMATPIQQLIQRNTRVKRLLG